MWELRHKKAKQLMVDLNPGSLASEYTHLILKLHLSEKQIKLLFPCRVEAMQGQEKEEANRVPRVQIPKEGDT